MWSLLFIPTISDVLNLSRISMSFKNKIKTYCSCIFPFSDKPKADGLKQTTVRVTRRSLSGQEWKPERAMEEVQSGEMMQRNPGSKVHTLALI